ncbi:serine hydrolase domain-containing protein [Sphingopyxis witflariensis]|uniref:serine hydrolase domain-containing protein n=1 Tax=Sphingopyxis witflariensis TaxID=173675 RepID=UPI001F43F1FE|nr:serine hydrolase domain-containing protein [Sphingopyxis witflariensis]
MIRLLLALSLILGFGTAAAAQTTIPQSALDDVQAIVEAAPGDIGLVVAVTDRDRMRFVATRGYADIARKQPVTPDTRFAIGSISKSFTAIALMQMADEGRFDPDAPITRYLPDFHPHSKFAPITGHALLTHTSGLPNYLAHVASMRFLIVALGDFEPRYAPGEHFWYLNTGYQLLGYTAEAIDGRPFPLILQKRVLDPLGMTATAPQLDDRLRGRIATSYVRAPDGTYVEAPWFDYLSADGAIVSNAADMGAYARMLLARGKAPDGRLISSRAFGRFATAVRDDYGYGIDVLDGGGVLAHSGSIAGFQAYLVAHLDEGFAVTFLSNGPLDKALRERIVARLSKAKARGAAPPTAAWPDAESFAGRFIAADGRELVFETDGSGGLMLAEHDAPLQLARLGKQSWGLYLTPKGPRAFLFFRDAAGIVTDMSEGAAGYARQGSERPLAEASAAYRALVGRYAAHGEEGPGVRIFVRGGQLAMAYADASLATPLIEEAPGRFRFAKPEHAPEWLAFDTVIGGQTQRLTFSGVPLYRIDLP